MSLRNIKTQLSDTMWNLRDEIARLKKSRKALLAERPDERIDLNLIMDELRDIDEELEKLSSEHDEIERSLRELSRPIRLSSDDADEVAASEQYLRIQADFGGDE